jgi:hypothetical protein
MVPSVPMPSMPMSSVPVASVPMPFVPMPFVPMLLVSMPATAGMPWHHADQKQHSDHDEYAYPRPPSFHGLTSVLTLLFPGNTPPDVYSTHDRPRITTPEAQESDCPPKLRGTIAMCADRRSGCGRLMVPCDRTDSAKLFNASWAFVILGESYLEVLYLAGGSARSPCSEILVPYVYPSTWVNSYPPPPVHGPIGARLTNDDEGRGGYSEG